jgi:dienelactone hydrolase
MRTVRAVATVAIGATPTLALPRSTAAARPARRRVAGPPFVVGLRVVTIVDPKRRVRIPGRGLVRRSLVTLLRYPAIGRRGQVDVVGAVADRAAGPFPLVVFGHGFAVTPVIYARLIQAWVRAGYVVAAPVFPLENANAPGGPNESDLVNQPADMSLVISRILAASADPANALTGLVNGRAIAVAGQSDGGETALGAAFYPQYLDRRIGAAVILSGAKLGPGSFVFPAHSPPLLATQGTADVINPPSLTTAFFDLAPAPKYLLTMFGASHLGPYTNEQPQLGIVERVTTAFLDRYLMHAPGAAARLPAAGDVPGTSLLHAYP